MNSIPYHAKISPVSDSPLRAAHHALKSFVYRLDRLLTAIAYAEAGNLDAVQDILDQDRVARKK